MIFLCMSRPCGVWCVAQVTVAVDEAKNEHEILQTFAEGADAPLE